MSKIDQIMELILSTELDNIRVLFTSIDSSERKKVKKLEKNENKNENKRRKRLFNMKDDDQFGKSCEKMKDCDAFVIKICGNNGKSEFGVLDIVFWFCMRFSSIKQPK